MHGKDAREDFLVESSYMRSILRWWTIPVT